MDEAGHALHAADPGPAGAGEVHDLHVPGAAGPGPGEEGAELRGAGGLAEEEGETQEMGERDLQDGQGKGGQSMYRVAFFSVLFFIVETYFC